MGYVILIIFIGALIWLVKKARQQAALNQAARDAFKAEHAGWDIFIAPFDQGVVAFGHDNRAIVIGTVKAHKQYPWSAIASVDVIQNGASITSTNRGSQIMGAAVGEVLLGPLGLLIGGVTGSKRTIQRVSQIAIKIIVDDRATPVHTITFLRLPGTGADPNNRLVRDAAQRAEHVHALLVNAIRNSAMQARIGAPHLEERSTADRIDQLWKLKETGALTDQEFQDQKAQLLGGRPRLPAGAR